MLLKSRYHIRIKNYIVPFLHFAVTNTVPFYSVLPVVFAKIDYFNSDYLHCKPVGIHNLHFPAGLFNPILPVGICKKANFNMPIGLFFTVGIIIVTLPTGYITHFSLLKNANSDISTGYMPYFGLLVSTSSNFSTGSIHFL